MVAVITAPNFSSQATSTSTAHSTSAPEPRSIRSSPSASIGAPSLGHAAATSELPARIWRDSLAIRGDELVRVEMKIALVVISACSEVLGSSSLAHRNSLRRGSVRPLGPRSGGDELPTGSSSVSAERRHQVITLQNS